MSSRKLAGIVAVVAVAGVLVAGVLAEEQNAIPETSRTILENAETWQLYSLHPNAVVLTDPNVEKPEELLHSWRVIGKTEIKDQELRQKLFAVFEKGVKENDGIVAGCFNPRHAISVTYKDQTADFIICFECMSVSVYRDGKPTDGFLITDSPQDTFNAVLKKAGVKLAAELEEETDQE